MKLPDGFNLKSAAVIITMAVAIILFVAALFVREMLRENVPAPVRPAVEEVLKESAGTVYSIPENIMPTLDRIKASVKKSAEERKVSAQAVAKIQDTRIRMRSEIADKVAAADAAAIALTKSGPVDTSKIQTTEESRPSAEKIKEEVKARGGISY
ncbi:MAG: hypothetical protein PHS46_01665 [Candidatus Omnitrophica bacterium]|nr:hypothetical protein [Candidatus Omnitrophota bacterium]